MLDPFMRRLIDPPLNQIARSLATLGVSANTVTLTGFVLSLTAAGAVAMQYYLTGLILFLTGRICDGLDGALSRLRSASDLGGYFDIVADLIAYAAYVLGFAFAREENTLPAAVLLFSFMGTGSTFLAYAVFAAKRGIMTAARGPKALYYLGGLTEGSETIIAFTFFSLFPEEFRLLAFVFAGLCLITTLNRVLSAARTFRTKN